MKLVKIYLPLIVFSLLFIEANAQNVSKRGTTPMSFLEIGMGARAVGMGSSFVAVADDPSAMFWNPAGILKLEGTQIMFEHNYWFAGISLNYFAATKNLGEYGAIGFSVTNSDVGDIEVTTVERPEGDGQTFTQRDFALSVTYAIQFTDKFLIGFNPKLVRETLWNTSATGIAIDIGILYETPFDGFSLGMAITNFGTKVKLEGNTTQVLYDPDIYTGGNNSRIPVNLSTDEFEMPLNYRVGISYKYLMDDNSKLVANIEAAHPNSNYESVNLGTEYSFHDFLYLRGGYESLFLDNSEKGMSLGAGIKYLVIGNLWTTFNYSYSDFGRLNNVQRVSINLNF